MELKMCPHAYPLCRLVLAACAAASLLFFHLGTDARAAPSFEGHVGTFVAANPPEVAPDTPFFDADGVQHRLSEYRGKVVLLNFWATWCPACVLEMPALDRLQTHVGSDKFVVLAISQTAGGAAVVRRFFKARGIENLSVLVDDGRKLGLAFNQDMLPTTVLLDPQGRDVGRLIGPADWDSREALAFIRFFLGRDAEATIGERSQRAPPRKSFSSNARGQLTEVTNTRNARTYGSADQ